VVYLWRGLSQSVPQRISLQSYTNLPILCLSLFSSSEGMVVPRVIQLKFPLAKASKYNLHRWQISIMILQNIYKNIGCLQITVHHPTLMQAIHSHCYLLDYIASCSEKQGSSFSSFKYIMLQIAEGMNYLLMSSKIMTVGFPGLHNLWIAWHLGVATLKTHLLLSLLYACLCNWLG